MKIILLFIQIFCLSFLLAADRIVPLPFVVKPDTLVVGDNEVFISSFPNVYIVSLSDGKLKKTFGNAGEGPREFKNFIRFHRHPQCLVINSAGKMSYFTKKGEFLREKRLPGSNVFKPVGQNYAGYRLFGQEKTRKNYVAVDIFDSKFNKLKEIYRSEFKFQFQRQEIFPVRNQGNFRVCEGKIIVNAEGGRILIFDSSGRRLISIQPDVEPIKITEEDRTRYKKYYREYPQYRQYYDAAKNWFRFPEYFPRIHEVYASDGKIYAETHEKRAGKRAFLIYDLEGKFIRKVFLPVSEINPIEKHIYTFKNNKFYQLVENEDTEDIELHITDLGE